MIPAEEAQACARGLLESAGLLSLPVDVVAAAAYCRLRIERVETLPPSVSGFLYRGKYRDEIVVNGREAPMRRRFTIAHEIGHWRLGDCGVALPAEFDWDTEYLTEQERNVNAFAAELLMPGCLLGRELALAVRSDELCRRFEVSRAAMRWRLQELDLQ